MKKSIVILLVALMCTSVFAGSFKLGGEQSLFGTKVTFGYDFGRWAEVGVKAGLPLINGVCNVIEESNAEPTYDSDGIQTNKWQDTLLETIYSPYLEVYGQFKAIDTEHFDMRLGADFFARTWGSVAGNKKGAYSFVYLAPSLELSYKFNDNARIYLNGKYPMLNIPTVAIGNPYSAVVAIAEAFAIVFDSVAIGASFSI
ncbi:MAG: hypothetical protein HUK23_01215 [Sphaerochaetaceae bacterium]|nr:hypothetical protein [Sphaerochaetaceae bacterium]